MNASTIYTSTRFQELVYYFLDHDLLDNGLHYARLYHSHEPASGDASHLLSLCHLRLNQFEPARCYSTGHGAGGNHLGCTYVLAQACLEMGRVEQGLAALDKSEELWLGTTHWSR